mmetsp:Transcript_115405/g.337462  ORF Transcript_115405/g.337462 Transcript_115405/m.337462 type:complete len:256 (-) Transcript_115405:251-1018(-)
MHPRPKLQQEALDPCKGLALAAPASTDDRIHQVLAVLVLREHVEGKTDLVPVLTCNVHHPLLLSMLVLGDPLPVKLVVSHIIVAHEVRRHLEDAAAALCDGAADRKHLVSASQGPGRQRALRVPVDQEPRGREAHGARGHGVLHEACHGLNLILLHRVLRGASRLVSQVGPFAHDPCADCAVANHHGDIASKLLALDGVEILLECLKIILQALRDDASWDVLHSFHKVCKEVASVCLAWRKPNTAVPHDASRHTS